MSAHRSSPSSSAAIVILAGGAGRRLGGVEKAIIDVAGRRLIDRALDRAREWTLPTMLAVRGTAPWHDAIDVAIVRDDPAIEGPLAGLIAAFRALPDSLRVLVSITVDCPFVPDDLAPRLIAATETSGKIAVATCGERHHHLLAAWPRAAFATIERVAAAGERAVHRAQAAHGKVDASWPESAADQFLNLNTAEDLDRARRSLAVERPTP